MKDKTKWTIVQNTQALHYYTFDRLDHEVLNVIKRVVKYDSVAQPKRSLISITLKLFECFLQVTGNHLSLLDLSSQQFNYTIKTFIGALWSNSFITATIIRRYGLTRNFKNTLIALQAIIPELSIPKIYFSSRHLTDDILVCIKQFELLPLIEDRIYYWHGWWAYNKKDQSWFIPLQGVYEHYGYAFTTLLFNQISIAFSCGRNGSIVVIADFCRWLPTSGYTLTQFSNATDVQRLFQDFLIYYMIAGYKEGEGNSIRNLVKRWRIFIGMIEKYFLDSIFAEPYGKLITPEPITIRGSERRINTTKDGIEVKEKLLTDIPLHITDDQAIELLFKQIQTDYDHIVTLAEHQANDLWQRFKRREYLTPKGIARHLKEAKKCRWLVNKNNPDWLANACATFKENGFASKKLLIFPSSHTIRESAFELGLPTSFAFIPYMVLLVAEHPQIVSSFLTQFELYNKQGKQTGFVQLDGGWVLDGRKARRGAANAQQIIPLTEKSKALVEQIIAITDCVRQHLKIKGDDNWRYLFLVCGGGFSPYRMTATYASAKKSQKTFYQALCSPSKDMTQEHAEKLSKRFSLGALRASKGVLIYLETRSVTAMAEALGHKEYSTYLLSHYLPETILDFFQSRWIRIFQQGIIIEAMKDSHLLLSATEFNNMNEFHVFMKNHALKIIPAHLENPDDEIIQSTLKFSDEIIFCINTGILTMLLSLRQAVINAQKRVCGKAAYWSELTKHLINHIENSSKHVSGEDFRTYLEEATKYVNPVKMEEIIYG